MLNCGNCSDEIDNGVLCGNCQIRLRKLLKQIDPFLYWLKIMARSESAGVRYNQEPIASSGFKPGSFTRATLAADDIMTVAKHWIKWVVAEFNGAPKWRIKARPGAYLSHLASWIIHQDEAPELMGEISAVLRKYRRIYPMPWDRQPPRLLPYVLCPGCGQPDLLYQEPHYARQPIAIQGECGWMPRSETPEQFLARLLLDTQNAPSVAKEMTTV
jgi:hypothetical protein